MRRHDGFTLAETLVVGAVLVVFILVMTVYVFGPPLRDGPGRTVTGTRLSSIYKALYVFSEMNSQKFPRYEEATNPDYRKTFAGSDINEIATARTRNGLHRNITATLWTMIKTGEREAKEFTCPPDTDAYVDSQLTTSGNPIESQAESWDFTAVKGKPGAPLSFSVMDMYDPKVADRWNPNVSADWVLMAEDNNNDGSNTPDGVIHGLVAAEFEAGRVTSTEVGMRENSSHHGYEGQNVMFGDGHAEFASTPFVGPNGDNIYAVGPPTASRNVSKLPASPTHDGNDVYLVPITGNVGGASTLHPYD